MTVSRIFSASEDAAAAVDYLKQAGFRDRDIQIVTSAGGYVSAASLVKKSVLKAHAESYAASVRQGATLIIVDAPLGHDGRATRILEGFGPSGPDAPKATHEGELWDEAAPLSSALGIPTLLKSAAPFSGSLGLSALSKKQTIGSSSFGIPLLSKSQSSKTALSNNPAILSSLFHIPVLLKGKSARS